MDQTVYEPSPERSGSESDLSDLSANQHHKTVTVVTGIKRRETVPVPVP